tara:strand:- start:760 stop:1929 length:1170 start_codon:yes stop_codon:yes gene_type:complete
MKLTTLLAVLFISSKLFSQEYGMVRVHSNLWVDQTEITNSEYRQFVSWVRDSIVRKMLFDSGLEKYGKSNTRDNHFSPNWDQIVDYSDTLTIKALELKGFWHRGNEQLGLKKEINVSRFNYRYSSSKGVVKTTMAYPDTLCLSGGPIFLDTEDTVGVYLYGNRNYFYNPAFDDYPVVGINYGQAIAFCHWRTKLYNNFAQEKGLNKTVKYTLPSIDNMRYISLESSQLHQEAGYQFDSNGNKYTFWGGLQHPDVLSVMNRFYESEAQYRKKLKTYFKKLGRLNSFENDKYRSILYPHYIVSRDPLGRNNFTNPAPAQSGFGVPSIFAKSKNNLVYGLSGNVAEMLIDQEVIGGSYLHFLEKCKVGELMEWDADERAPWLGFRCVMYYVE